ncbi:hypothetical protein GGR51DRAFT_312049 [Nemania sp. FL0031]|nr:hypothetical protein GGR51DRAFT_312049 [Nemania sp. FL0031]
MADPIATLSLASSILQVIDFASGFATTAWKIYQAADRSRDGPDELVELRKITNSLADVLREIQSQSNVSGAAIMNGNDGIVSLAKECATLVKKLLQTLPDETHVTRKRDAIRVAFKLKWKSEDIRALQSRLAEFRSQLTLNLLVSMRQYASQSMAQQERIMSDLSTMNRNSNGFKALDNNGERIGSSILEYVTSKLRPTTKLEERHILHKNITQAIQGSPGSGSSSGLLSLHLSMSDRVQMDSIHNLLASLTYSSMDDREWRVVTAHHETFRWLFDESPETQTSSFKDWLSSEEKLYWITGKAGSGKSTLMKYISHPNEFRESRDPRARCYEDLSKWSGDSRLIIASFYFWNTGVHMQATQKGMMMTLLYQILKQCPGLAPFVSPARWETLCLFGAYSRDWDERELRDSVHNAISNAQYCDARIALFIDGLDEFEGKSEELIELLRDILRLPRLKVCVSSRPWTAFEDAFRYKPSLKVEDLTYNDIKRFVISRFEDEPLFQDLRDQEGPYADALVESIVSRAQGVFLWVSLVVSSLITGFCSGDRVSDLEKRLALLPPDLEGLYEKILRSLDPFYLEHTAQLFSLVGASRGSINAIVASFADEEAPRFCLERRVQEMSEGEIRRRIDMMRRRINTRTKGLLEVNRSTIQYLHRTVKDYIESEAVQKTFHSATNGLFDPHLRLLAGLITSLKTLENQVIIEKIGSHLFDCMEHAGRVAKNNVSSMVVLLDELDKVISTLLKRQATTSDSIRRVTREKGLWVLEFSPLDAEIPLFGNTFLSLAVAFNIVEYVQARAPFSCLVNKPSLEKDLTISYEPWPLIMDVVHTNSRFFFGKKDPVYPVFFTPRPEHQRQSSHIRMLECLLAKSADPMRRIAPGPLNMNTSFFIEIVTHMIKNQNEAMAETVRLLAQAGTVDNRTLARIITRLKERVFGARFSPLEDAMSLSWPLKSQFEKLRRIVFRDTQLVSAQYLRHILEDICDVNKPSPHIDYVRLLNLRSEGSIEQLVLASQLTTSLTVGAKVFGHDPASSIRPL